MRGPRREVISRGYNLLLRASLGAEFSDAQCGFKAIRRDQARALLPLTEDTGSNPMLLWALIALVVLGVVLEGAAFAVRRGRA